MIPSRYTNLDAARAKFGDRIDRLAPFLLRTDPLADACVEAMAGVERGGGFQLLESMLAKSEVDPSAPPAMRQFIEETARVPAWVDWPTVDSAGAVLHRAGLLGGLVLGTFSLPLGYASPGGNKPLVFSGRLTEQAPRRLSETSRFVQAVSLPGGMRRGADGYRITLKVRVMHAHVRRMLIRSGKWDESTWGAPINQHDMAATTLLFSAVLLEGLRRLGLSIEREEAEKYMHLWRYVGLLSGVDPELLSGSELEGIQLGNLIQATQGPPDEDSRGLVRALVDSPLASVRDPRQLRGARMRVNIGHGLMRGMLGPELADKLGLEPTPWENAMRVFRTAGALGDRAVKLSPTMRQKAVTAGEKYWDEVVRLGLRGGPYEFRPQEKLQRPPL